MTPGVADPRIAVLEEKFKTLNDSVTKLLVKLEDNGRLGLFSRMANAEHEIEVIKQQHLEEERKAEKAADRRNKLVDGVVTAAIIMVLSNIGLIVTVVTQLSKGAK